MLLNGFLPWRAPRWSANGSVVILTGASSGIGRELTLQLAGLGASVVAVARRQDRLDDLVQSFDLLTQSKKTGVCPGNILPVVGDITQAATRESAFLLADSIRQGQLDLLVNNAGVGGIGPFIDASEERARQIMEVNFFAPLEWTREAIPRLKQTVSQFNHQRSETNCSDRQCAPAICNIGSVLGHRSVPDKSEYSASKFALHGWSDSLRAELAPHQISVTLVSPSTTSSEFFDSLVDTDPSQKSKSLGSWPPDRVAHATLQAIERRRSEVILSLGGKALVYLDRLCPPLLNAILANR